MPTVPAPSNTAKTPVRPTTPPPAPPQPMTSTTKPPTAANLTTIVFILIALFLCSLIGYSIWKITSNGSFVSLDAPVLKPLPEFTNKASLVIEGTAPTGSTVEIPVGNAIAVATTDELGNFKAVVELKEEGKSSFTAVAKKRVFFTNVTSKISNEVSTTYDKTAPNIKLITPPKTVTKNTYTLEGSISEPASIAVVLNGKTTTVATDKDNKFSLKLTFVKGANTIKITATDPAGNQTVSAQLTTTFTTGIVRIPNTRPSQRNLPDSAGNLPAALNTLFTRYIAIAAVILTVLGFAASSSIVWLIKKQ